ncbi:hypothetical protein J2T13_004570 [Paenibacillus sp. DS2015]
MYSGFSRVEQSVVEMSIAEQSPYLINVGRESISDL